MKIVLASASPRRRELLEMLGIPELEIIPALGEEQPHPELDPAGLVQALSAAKAGEVYEKHSDAAVIAADTVVVLNGKAMGKPSDEEDARRMLRLLSGNTHTVFTGVTVMCSGRTLSHAESTAVTFRKLSDAEIDAYIATKEPMDKAGAYGAQGIGALFVEHLDGDFFNVMGLPLCALSKMLAELGVSLI